MKGIKFIIILIGFYSTMSAQLDIGKEYGFNVGFVGAFGTHIQRFGIVLQGYAVYDFAQINASVRVYDNFRSLGPRGEHTEFSGAFGLCLGYGNQWSEKNRFISAVGNQTNYRNSVAYSYNVWSNRIKTSQVTGIVALQFYHVSIIIENDLFAKPTLDRFRTGAFLLQYQDQHFQYALNCTLWTGQMGMGVRNDSLFPRNGYVSAENGIYSNLSHGLLSAQIKYADPYGQYSQFNAGVDAEQVRNVVQNKIIHEVPFTSKKRSNRQNLYIPMIATDGNQYLYRPQQKIKSIKLFLNAYTSANIFY